MVTEKAPRKTGATKKVGKAPLAHGVGRRKSSVARVWLTRGSGKIVVNGKEVNAYFDTLLTRKSAQMAFEICPVSSVYDVQVNVSGGGKAGQADAVKLGISRALLQEDETLRPALKKHGLLTSDSRLKERKKYGQKAARRKFQFVKR
jgi:small subunit ribosomal protein S9